MRTKTYTYILLIFALLLFSCNTNKKMQNIKIEPLSHYHYEFRNNDNNQLDTFYILEEENVVFDLIKNQETNFEFEQ